MRIHIHPPVDEETAAAILAAMSLLEAPAERAVSQRSRWAAAGNAASQGLGHARRPMAWRTADRQGRLEQGSGGVPGLFEE